MEKELDEKLKKAEDELIENLNDYLVTESDVKVRHALMIRKILGDDYVVSTEWGAGLSGTGANTRAKFDLAVIKRWPTEEKLGPECFKKYKPVYAAEYKLDDQKTFPKTAQMDGFINQVRRLHEAKLERAFALYHYRGVGSNWDISKEKTKLDKLGLSEGLNLRVTFVHNKKFCNLYPFSGWKEFDLL